MFNFFTSTYNNVMKWCAWILIILSASTLGLAFYKFYNAFSHPIKFEKEIIFYAEKFDLSPCVVASLINVESKYNTYAKSHKNAIGLMQIKLTTANYIGGLNKKNKVTETELLNPEINIEFGCMYLQYLNKKFENIYTSLAAYNAGETIVRSWLSSNKYSTDGKSLNNIPYKETRTYVEKIQKNLKFYRKIYKK